MRYFNKTAYRGAYKINIDLIVQRAKITEQTQIVVFNCKNLNYKELSNIVKKGILTARYIEVSEKWKMTKRTHFAVFAWKNLDYEELP